jgi:uncharacterized protein YdaU (DUF1376 family)
VSAIYYRFFPGDYLRDTRFLSLMQHGAYHLLIHEYMTNGPLPNDLLRLYRIVGAQSNEERAAVETVLTEFFLLDGPVWRHKRCDEERGDQQRFRDKQRANAQKRWAPAPATADANADATGHATGHTSGDAMAMLPHMPRECLPTTTTTKKKHSSVVTDGFARFWMTWPKSERKVAKAECFKRWKARGLEGEADAICAHVEALRQSKQWRDGYEPAPLTYLNQRRWEDGAPADAASDLMAGAV